MDKAQYESAMEAVFDRMDQHRPSQRAPLTLEGNLGSMGRVAWHVLAWTPAVLASAGAVYVNAHWGMGSKNSAKDVIWIGVLIGGVISMIFQGIASNHAEAENLKGMHRRLISNALVRKIADMGGRGFQITEAQAERISALADKYPRVQEAATRWAAQSAAHTLTTRELSVLGRVKRELDAIEKDWTVSETDRIEAEKVVAALNKNHMIDRAIALSQATEMVADLPATANTARRAPARM